MRRVSPLPRLLPPHLVVLPLLLGLAACGDDDPAPLVVVLEVSPDSLDPADDAADDLTIRVEYYDADGDLGEGVAEVHDCRAAGLVVHLDIPPIASAEAVAAGVPIEGRLDLLVTDIGAVEPDDAAPPACADLGVAPLARGEAIFCVVLVDAAGNAGPGDCTPAVAVP